MTVLQDPSLLGFVAPIYILKAQAQAQQAQQAQQVQQVQQAQQAQYEAQQAQQAQLARQQAQSQSQDMEGMGIQEVKLASHVWLLQLSSITMYNSPTFDPLPGIFVVLGP